MSLLHQVLQQIDDRGALQDPLQPVPATMVPVAAVARFSPVLLVLGAILLLALLLFAGWPKPVPVPETVPVAAAVVSAEPVDLSSESFDSPSEPVEEPPADAVDLMVAVTETNAADRLVSPASAAADITPENAVANQQETAQASVIADDVRPVVPANNVEPDEYLNNVTPVPASAPAPAMVIRTGAEARQWYQQALIAVRQQRWDDAQQAITQALRTDPRDEYAALQLRVYLQQQRGEDFLRYYRQERQRQAPAWLSVAAPGLHLLGFYADAAVAYRQLLAQQNRPQWALALAAALWDDGQRIQAQAVLQSIQPARLSAEQQAWVTHILSEPST